jgi:carbon-monoxide dehydrogenase small subunit
VTDLHPLAVTVNGARFERSVEPRRTLVDFLRHDLRLYGVHAGCEQGACGACTVQVDGCAVKSCLMLAVQADGREVRTVEGLAPGVELHPLQQAFRDAHALQCGFCTPGFLMLADAISGDRRRLRGEALRRELAGNLCRCTGYISIVEAVSGYLDKTATKAAP